MADFGILYVVSTPIGNLADMTPRAVTILDQVDIIACEDTRSSKTLLNRFDIKTKCLSYHEHSDERVTDVIVEKIKKGENIALISDAGTPLISDPGFKLVRKARALGISIIPIPGSCAAISALSVSGLNTDAFLFKGFLPRKREDRKNTLEQIRDYQHTIIFYESPHRVLESIKDMKLILGNKRKIFMAREMTKLFETYFSGTIDELIEFIEKDPSNTKGEIVLIVEQCGEDATKLKKDHRRILKLLLSEMSSSKAASIAAKITDENKKLLYKEAIMLLENDKQTDSK